MATTQSPGAFLSFVDETFSKNRQFLNASRIYNYQAEIAKLCEIVSPIFDSFKNIIVIGMGKTDQLKRDKWKNRAKTEKLPNFPGI